MTAIVERATGRLIKTISAPDDIIALNTPEGCYVTDDPPGRNMYHVGGVWEHIPHSPGPGFVFDYHTKEWVDTRNVSDVKAVQWEKLKAQRDELEYAGFEFEGRIYDSDMNSQGRISTAASLGAPVEWTLQDNSTIWLSPDDLQGLVQALAQHVTSVHARGRIARNAIEAATTKEEVESINL